jgi:hypothetical protein
MMGRKVSMSNKKSSKKRKASLEEEVKSLYGDFLKELQSAPEPLSVVGDSLPRYYAKFNGIKFPLNTLAELEGLLESIEMLKSGSIPHFYGSTSSEIEDMTEVILIEEILTPITIEAGPGF